MEHLAQAHCRAEVLFCRLFFEFSTLTYSSGVKHVFKPSAKYITKGEREIEDGFASKVTTGPSMITNPALTARKGPR
jgi:hypothetical protein